MNSKKTILSLFDYSGNWSEPYRKAGYNVIQIDKKLGSDLFAFDYKAIGSVYGILAAPPCTCFTVASAHLWQYKDESGQTFEDLLLIDKTLEIIEQFNPNFYCIENPCGRLPQLRPNLKKIRLMTFQPYQFGDPYTKQTELFGHFNPLMTMNILKPIKATKTMTSIDRYYKVNNLTFNQRKELRSTTPKGFAQAFFKANQ
jgi:hypothetical protein